MKSYEFFSYLDGPFSVAAVRKRLKKNAVRPNLSEILTLVITNKRFQKTCQFCRKTKICLQRFQVHWRPWWSFWMDVDDGCDDLVIGKKISVYLNESEVGVMKVCHIHT